MAISCLHPALHCRPDWQQQIAPLPSLTAYCQHLRELAASKPVMLIAHSYTQVGPPLHYSHTLRRSHTHAPLTHPALLTPMRRSHTLQYSHTLRRSHTMRHSHTMRRSHTMHYSHTCELLAAP